ncbi:hypothetical protein ACFQ0B_70225 [Nonomuraea thailandensis]
MPISNTGRPASRGARPARLHRSPARSISATSASPLVPRRGSRSSPNAST